MTLIGRNVYSATAPNVTIPDNEGSEENLLVKESILLSIKKLLGLLPEMKEFDTDLIMLINSSLNVLTQIGVGPCSGFIIHSDEEVWGEFIGDEIRINMVKSYIFMKVKLLWDSSQMSGATTSAYNEEIKQLEWRLNLQTDIMTKVEGGDN